MSLFIHFSICKTYYALSDKGGYHRARIEKIPYRIRGKVPLAKYQQKIKVDIGNHAKKEWRAWRQRAVRIIYTFVRDTIAF